MFKTQIEAILSLDYHSKSYFQGCFAIDRLPQKRKARSSAYVINYDEHDKDGSHWIAVLSDQAGNVEFFDSSGQPPLLDQTIALALLNCNKCLAMHVDFIVSTIFFIVHVIDQLMIYYMY